MDRQQVRVVVAAVGGAVSAGVLALAVSAGPARPVAVTVSLVAQPTAAPMPGVTATGAGAWSVPDQLAPGVYRTAGSTNPNRQCTWNRFAGPDLAIVDTGLGNPGEPQTVTIASDDGLFEATDCGAWTRVK